MARRKYSDKAEFARYCGGRAKKARGIVAEAYDEHDIPTSISDCLADLMHLAKSLGVDWWDLTENAQTHFNAEQIGGEHG